MNIRRPEMMLIDVDGTLVDSVPDLSYCVDTMMAQLGRAPHGEGRVRDWVGNGVERLVKRALVGALEGEPDPADFGRAYPLFLELYAENTSKRSIRYPGILEGLDLLDALSSKGGKVLAGCASDKDVHGRQLLFTPKHIPWLVIRELANIWKQCRIKVTNQVGLFKGFILTRETV